MRLSAKRWRWFGLALAVVALGFLIVRTWVVPAVIVGQIRKEYRGRVVIGDWWFGLRSAGVTGIELGESAASDSPAWFKADRVSTDVSLARLIRGHAMPTRVEIDHPVVSFRFDAKGQPSTKIPVVPPAEKEPKATPDLLPEIVTEDGEVTLQQEGRKPMTISHVNARLAPVEGSERLDVTTDDPTWGKVKVSGRFEPGFKKGDLEIDSSPGFVAEPDKIERIPFIPKEVWANLEPRGPVDARVKIHLDADAPKPVRVYTELTLKGTSARLATLQVEATDTTGRVVVDDALVTVTDLKGKTLDGTLAAGGTLDFGQVPPRFDLGLRLREIDVTKAPASWQLGEVGATGKLTGKVDLRALLPPAGVDLDGTTGEAVIENGSFQGIPIKSLSISMKANGGDLQFETLPQGSLDKKALESAPIAATAVAGGPKPHGKSGLAEVEAEAADLIHPAMHSFGPVLAALPLVRLITHDDGVLGWSAFVASEVVGFQAAQGSTQGGPAGKLGGIRLPKSISTKIELEDVDLQSILVKVEKFGIKIPVPVAGRFSIKASATIPLGALREIKAYAFHGDASLKGASIDHVDIGQVFAHIDLANGVLDLSDFRGQFVDHPAGSDKQPPAATAAPPRTGELPPGGFRARLRAEVSPPGLATARIEGRQLPLGELFAPFLPVPTPLSGDLSIDTEAKVDLAKLADPKSYILDGRIESRRIAYKGAVLDHVATQLHVKAGHVDLADFSARLAGHPLKLTGGVDLAPPYAYSGKLVVAGWEIADVLAFVPGLPKPAPASGIVDANGEAAGTGFPFTIKTHGGVRVARAKAGPTPLGNVVFQWTTDRDTIAITGLEAAVFGGKITGEARIPTKPGPLLEASATIKGIDTARVSAALPSKSVSLAGRADGGFKVAMPLDLSVVDAEAHLAAPDLRIKEGAGAGVRVESFRFKATARSRVVDYLATADTLGGKIRFQGSIPIDRDPSRMVAQAELRAAGFRLNEAWHGLGIGGALAELDGQAALAANLRASLAPARLWSRGAFELRGLHYGSHLPLGGLHGQYSLTPTAWHLDQVGGELLGGIASGEARGEGKAGGPKRVAFDFKVERASLHKMMGAVPHLAHGVDGFGSLRVAGRLDETLHATADVSVARARVMGLDITNLRLPAEIVLSPSSGIGSVHSRHWAAHLAGGSVMGNTLLRLGADRSFQAEVRLAGVDLEVLTRLEDPTKRPSSGKLSGKIKLNGPNPNDLAKIRGRVDLDDASLVELPVVRELDRFLGAAQGGGGLFEDGDLHGTIYNRTLFVDQLTLEGRLIQVHATGTITFDGGLNLEVLVNTKQTIPQSGLTLVNVIPGLGAAVGRSEEAILRVASFLSSKLLKFRVGGTIKNPTVNLDAGVGVGDTAVGFFSGVLKVTGGGR